MASELLGGSSPALLLSSEKITTSHRLREEYVYVPGAFDRELEGGQPLLTVGVGLGEGLRGGLQTWRTHPHHQRGHRRPGQTTGPRLRRPHHRGPAMLCSTTPTKGVA